MVKKKSKLKKLLKKSKVEYKMPKYETEDVFDDPNRFFKNEMGETEMSMFFK